MSPKTVSAILAKLERLQQYIGYLDELRKFSQKQFEQDHRIHGLAERYLQLSIEIIIDVSRLVLITKNLERPDNNHETLELLVKHKMISKPLFERTRKIIGFRNILVHDYMKLDLTIVYKQVHTGLRDFKDFKKAILRKVAKG